MTDEAPAVKPANIHEAIAAIMKEVGYVQKTRNSNLNYSFAGETALIGALRPWMVEYDVIMYVADVTDVVHEWYTTERGKPMLNTTLRAVICFLHAPSGTFIEVVSVGEGSDSGDKSQNKALTGAFKYALRQTFMIETGDDPDKDSSDGMVRQAGTSGAKKRNQAALVAYAKTKGLDNAALGKALGLAGFKAVDLSRWDEMIAAVDSYQP